MAQLGEVGVWQKSEVVVTQFVKAKVERDKKVDTNERVFFYVF